VQIFLDKHSRLATDKKRWIDVARFAAKDVDIFKAKLASSSSLLQISLVSLSR
jgi:hypothetical protein